MGLTRTALEADQQHRYFTVSPAQGAHCVCLEEIFGIRV